MRMTPLKTIGGIAATLVLAALALADTDTIMLKTEAYVKGPALTLGDVADVQGENADALADIEIGNAAMPGDSKRLDASLVRSRIENAGFTADSVEIQGPGSVVATTLYSEITSDMLATDLRTFIEGEMPWALDEATIDVAAPTQNLVVPDGLVEVRWWPNPQYRWVGPGVFRGEVTVDGEVKRTVLVRAQVEAYTEVLVAATDIPRGSLISVADLQLEKRAMSQMRGNVLQSTGDAVGQVARSTIFPGQVITSRQLMPRQLIKRNQPVTVEARAGRLVIRSQARALMNGCEGDLITCVNPDSREEFQGVVRKDGVVVVN
ncbi:MAG: flagellar basal body P-ring formation protein FlgA [Candidatus Hydrogenedentes bacterium]|nr:flagellar basal body P-ring formation protein FlgA [Candidatus Hydrogenedentota bacterium]